MGWQGGHDRTRRGVLTGAEAEAARDVLAEIMQGSLTYAGKSGVEGACLLFDIRCPATLHKALCGVEVSYLTASSIRRGLRRVDRLPPRVAP